MQDALTTNNSRALDHRTRTYRCMRANLDIILDNRKRTDANAASNTGTAGYLCRRMNTRLGSRVCLEIERIDSLDKTVLRVLRQQQRLAFNRAGQLGPQNDGAAFARVNSIDIFI